MIETWVVQEARKWEDSAKEDALDYSEKADGQTEGGVDGSAIIVTDFTKKSRIDVDSDEETEDEDEDSDESMYLCPGTCALVQLPEIVPETGGHPGTVRSSTQDEQANVALSRCKLLCHLSGGLLAGMGSCVC